MFDLNKIFIRRALKTTYVILPLSAFLAILSLVLMQVAVAGKMGAEAFPLFLILILEPFACLSSFLSLSLPILFSIAVAQYVFYAWTWVLARFFCFRAKYVILFIASIHLIGISFVLILRS